MHVTIDFRSDTTTRPGPLMRKAMMEAQVGDVVYNEDPTVKRLEREVAGLLGKEAAIFLPSGTMANTIAIRLCAGPGDEVVAESNSHPIFYEAGGAAAFSGVIFKAIPGDRGLLTARQVQEAIYAPAYYRPIQTAVLIENTHNRGGGTVYPVELVRDISEVARNHGLRVHMDGARLWNASVASTVPMAEYARHADTVSVCFSKGLGAPVGSALAGSVEDIERAWHFRHMLGGSWRQAGILAAGALYAIKHNVPRLSQDHENATRLAEGLESCGLELLNRVETNMVYFALPDADRKLKYLAEHNILMSEVRPDVVRCVTHLDLDAEDVDCGLERIRRMI